MVTEQEATSQDAVEDAPVPSPALQRLLDAASTATPFERIGYRDPIAAFGPEAITAVTPWLSDRVLAAFSVRVILHAGAVSDHEAAVRVLQKGRSKVPWFVREYIDAALRQLYQLMPDHPWRTNRHPLPLHAPLDDAHPRPRRAAIRVSTRWPSHPDDAS